MDMRPTAVSLYSIVDAFLGPFLVLVLIELILTYLSVFSHLWYLLVSCYEAYIFAQKLSLYAPVVNNEQASIFL